MIELLTVEQMSKADRLTIEGGISGFTLMQNAGVRIFEHLEKRWSKRPVLVLCGPGNNGGDGFVIAQYLHENGWPVQVSIISGSTEYSDDAGEALKQYQGAFVEPTEINWDQPDLIVDAIFGAGLSREIVGPVADLIAKANKSGADIVAVDIPSGVDGNTGELRGETIDAEQTVTFFRAKPGHYLWPGKGYVGRLYVEQIGIANDVLPQLGINHFENLPTLWNAQFPRLHEADHKYTRGSACVLSGDAYSGGAARLAAMASLRIGAGVVRVLSEKQGLPIHAAHLNEIMLAPVDNIEQFASYLSDPRLKSIVLGPGGGVGDALKEKTLKALRSAATAVLDADALTSFSNEPDSLFQNLRPGDIITPHEGEFLKLFGATENACRIVRAKTAAEKAGCVIVMKGPDTIIAAPDGRCAINTNGTPLLATAGSGDVLAGLIAGLIAQGMSSFEAAAAAVWIHAECARKKGFGLIASDLFQAIPAVLTQLNEAFDQTI